MAYKSSLSLPDLICVDKSVVTSTYRKLLDPIGSQYIGNIGIDSSKPPKNAAHLRTTCNRISFSPPSDSSDGSESSDSSNK